MLEMTSLCDGIILVGEAFSGKTTLYQVVIQKCPEYLFVPGGGKSAGQAGSGGGRGGEHRAQDHHEPQGPDHQPDVRLL